MKEKLPDVSQTDGRIPATAHGMTVAGATILSLFCAIVTIVGTVALLKSSWGTSARVAASGVTLVAVLALGYALVQLTLAVLATAGERRWFARQVSERRSGERARKQKD